MRQWRGAVTHLRTAYPVSDRRACRLVQLARSRWQYRRHGCDDGPLAAALAAKAAALRVLRVYQGGTAHSEAAAAHAGEYAARFPTGRGGREHPVDA